MRQRLRHTAAAKAKIFLLLLAFLSLPLLSAPGMADEPATTVATVPTERSLMQQAIEHAKQHYGIDILTTDELLRNPLAPWTKAKVTAERWIDQVFKAYDKIVFYNEHGKIKTLHIVGLKNGRNAVAQRAPAASKVTAQASVTGNADLSATTDAIALTDPSTELSPEEEGFIIHPQTEEQELPEGVTIYHNNGEADDLTIAGVILH